ncbi:hypothetical protein H7I76_23865, partial [Mycolicibacterium vaccae]|nr:hypothetical protein [Mycolicibacterium vaccae]
MAEKRKRPTYDLKAAGRRRDLAFRIGFTAVFVIFAVALIGYIVISHEKKDTESRCPGGAGDVGAS